MLSLSYIYIYISKLRFHKMWIEHRDFHSLYTEIILARVSIYVYYDSIYIMEAMRNTLIIHKKAKREKLEYKFDQS